ncbi:MAG: TCP-1/cpn60 chaperonin family protein [Acidimicrobiales bacterium]
MDQAGIEAYACPRPSTPIRETHLLRTKNRSLRSRRSRPTTAPLVSSSPTQSTRSARTASSPSRSQTPSAWSSNFWKVCASTRAISLPIWRPTPAWSGLRQSAHPVCRLRLPTSAISFPFEKVRVQTNRQLVVIAEDVDGEALSTLVVNKIRVRSTPCCRQGPRTCDRRKAMLQDMASSRADRSSSKRSVFSLRTATLDLLGTARKVVVTKDETTIIDGGGEGRRRRTNSRFGRDETPPPITIVRSSRNAWPSSGGVAVLKVGAATEVELKEKKHRIEDAVSTTKAAIEEGIVCGGGVTLLRAQSAVFALADTLEGDIATGARIVGRALQAPLNQIAENAGMEGGLAVDKVRSLEGWNGLNAATGEYEDLQARGVVDAAKVTRSGVQNAGSIAALFLTTEAVVSDAPAPSADDHGHDH